MLANDESSREWLEHVESLGEPHAGAGLPPAHQLAPVLLDLAVPHEDIDFLVALAAQVETSPDLSWLLKRCVQSLCVNMGKIGGRIALPPLPDPSVPLARYFYVLVFVATLPHARAFHQSRGIPEVVSRRTFADLGRNIAVHRKRHGVGGLHAPNWQTLHFTGALYDLGRLQFERATLGRTTSAGIQAAGFDHEPGEYTLSVHIPAFSGPITPRVCDESFERAGEFFTRYFPEEPYATAVCHSWLMDAELREYLPDSSNIIQFQKRFRLAYRSDDANDDGPLSFVFGRTTRDLDGLPRETTLQRAIVDHIRAGRHWHDGAGWLELR